MRRVDGRFVVAQPGSGRMPAAGVPGSPGRGGSIDEIRIGFVPLIDAAPVISAHELGYFKDEGLDVSLHQQIGWGNVRDKLIYGQLHAGHTLFGMPPASVLKRERYPEPLVSLMALGTGGDMITLSWTLIGAGVDSPPSLARWLRSRSKERPPTLGHVFSCSVHHYLLREWLASGGVDPDRDVRLCVLPPPQMPGHVTGGYLDGYCAGEPWNTVVGFHGSGKIVAVTTDIVPAHPDKVLAVRRRWLDAHPRVGEALVRAVLRACGFCSDPAHYLPLSEMLSRPHYIGVAPELILKGLSAGEKVRSCAPQTTFPSVTHAAWLVGQMVRWGHVPGDTDVNAVARRSIASEAYRSAAAQIGVECPPSDAPPMRLRNGWFSLQEHTKH
jgi:ABC-type nitrate/sulfonate/bicarbonate transport system substrate-binding protein